jgi:CRP/FNR family transcriptional regulator, cyclic AMP receptor protein
MPLRDEIAARELDPAIILERPGTGITVEKYRKNQRIFVQGDPAGAVGYIRSGTVKATILSAVGKEAIVGVFRQGQFFGEASLDSGNVRSATVVALDDCVITLIARETMLSLLQSEPALATSFLRHLLSRNDRLESDLIAQLLHSTEQRLARLLLLLADYGPNNETPIPIPMSQEALAEMIGTTRSRVSTFMNKFRERGFIDYDSSGHIQVYVGLLLSVLGS